MAQANLAEFIQMLQQPQRSVESGGNDFAVSPAGAQGPFQIMPATARDPGFGVTPLRGWNGVDPMTAPYEEQARFRGDYMNAMGNLYGNITDALMAYNAGPGTIDKVISGKIPYSGLSEETRSYPGKVYSAANLQPAAPAMQSSGDIIQPKGRAEDILSSRFNITPTFSDVANSALQTAVSDKYVSPNDVAKGNIADQLAILDKIASLKKNIAYADYYGAGGSKNTPAALQLNAAYEAAVARGDTAEADRILLLSKSIEKGTKLGPNGEVQIRPGAADAAGALASGEKFGGAVGTEAGKGLIDMRNKATDATQALRISQEARNLLDSGVITGTGADFLTGLGNVLSSRLGFQDAADPVANTQAFVATMAGEVANSIKAFGSGTGLSNADREYATKMVGGQIQLNEQSIRKILDIRDKQNRWIIDRYNLEYGKAPQSSMPYDLSVPAPAPTTPSIKPPTPEEEAEYLRLKGGR